MTIANVTLLDTFDSWRTKTNQLIVQSEQSFIFSVAAFENSNSASFTAANLAANVLLSNTTVMNMIDNTANIIVTNYVANTNLAVVHNKANLAFSQSNTALSKANQSLIIANNAANTALAVEANVATITVNALMSNATIINIIGATANSIAANVLANVDLITVGNVAPVAPLNGQIWWNPDVARLLIYYTDVDSSQWVDTNPVTNLGPVYDTANLASNTATVARNTANLAPIAFDVTNSAYGVANAAYNFANTVNTALASVGGGGTTVVIGNETSSTNTFYLTFSSNTSGNASSLNVSSTKLTFNPSTGTLSSTVFNSLSDINVKDNIIPLTNALESVEKMNGVGFTWKDSGRPSFGIIAQQLEEIAPALVDQVGDMKTVNYDGIIAFLIEAIKELNNKIENGNKE